MTDWEPPKAFQSNQSNLFTFLYHSCLRSRRIIALVVAFCITTSTAVRLYVIYIRLGWYVDPKTALGSYASWGQDPVHPFKILYLDYHRVRTVRNDVGKEPLMQQGRRPSSLGPWTVRTAAEGTVSRYTPSVWWPNRRQQVDKNRLWLIAWLVIQLIANVAGYRTGF
jgi:hypothetical protein